MKGPETKQKTLKRLRLIVEMKYRHDQAKLSAARQAVTRLQGELDAIRNTKTPFMLGGSTALQEVHLSNLHDRKLTYLARGKSRALANALADLAVQEQQFACSWGKKQMFDKLVR